MKAFVTVLLLCLVAVQAGAQEPAGTCPPVYGRWRTAYAMDKFGVPQPLEPPGGRPGLIMEARIDQKTAVLIWHGGRRVKFKRRYKFEQTACEFHGLSESGRLVITDTNVSPVIRYPDDKKYLDLNIYSKEGHVGALTMEILMTKIE